ncbi:PAAR domain-containing protein [Aeromonas hydrophila]|uniref:PAAR domain-containing protein n=1 Tax=Aeromonas hydrophila TaxID=644 RepID=A0A926FKI9_AERHY|nr:PAAR domain-containing protein [Aeromonas hydrophila]
MSLKIATIGDPTTTGGAIIDGASTVFAEGRLVALIGSQATCPACQRASARSVRPTPYR